MPLTLDADFLTAALVGYQEMLKQIDTHIAEISTRLGKGVSAASAVAASPAAKKRTLSATGRAHIIAALKKRWAAVKKAKAAASDKIAPKPAAPKAKAAVPAKKAAAKQAVKRAGRKAQAKTAKPAAIKKATVKRRIPRKAAADTLPVPEASVPNAQTGATE